MGASTLIGVQTVPCPPLSGRALPPSRSSLSNLVSLSPFDCVSPLLLPEYIIFNLHMLEYASLSAESQLRPAIDAATPAASISADTCSARVSLLAEADPVTPM